MIEFPLVPSWFFGLDSLLKLLFTIVTAAVSFYAYKVYRLTGTRDSKLLTSSFLLISAGYFITSMMNFLVYLRVKKGMVTVVEAANLGVLRQLATYAFMAFFLVGLLTLVYMTLKKKDVWLYLLLIIIPVVAFILSNSPNLFFQITSSALLLYLTYYYYKNYKRVGQKHTLMVFLAFSSLLLARVQFIFSVLHQLFYPLGHLFELIAYALLITGLWWVTR